MEDLKNKNKIIREWCGLAVFLHSDWERESGVCFSKASNGVESKSFYV